jgi:hypothetical protein
MHPLAPVPKHRLDSDRTVKLTQCSAGLALLG